MVNFAVYQQNMFHLVMQKVRQKIKTRPESAFDLLDRIETLTKKAKLSVYNNHSLTEQGHVNGQLLQAVLELMEIQQLDPLGCVVYAEIQAPKDEN